MVSTRLMFFMCRDHDRGCQSGFLLYPVDGADFGDSNLVWRFKNTYDCVGDTGNRIERERLNFLPSFQDGVQRSRQWPFLWLDRKRFILTRPFHSVEKQIMMQGVWVSISWENVGMRKKVTRWKYFSNVFISIRTVECTDNVSPHFTINQKRKVKFRRCPRQPHVRNCIAHLHRETEREKESHARRKKIAVVNEICTFVSIALQQMPGMGD